LSFARIFAPREKLGFGALESAVLAVYSALVLFTVAHHVPWADEAQSWLLARDLSLRSLFGTQLHYEGTPGLWHFFLWILCRLSVSYTAMHWVAAVFPIAGIAVFLRSSPFPAVLRIALPFSFYVLYQYAVIARSYIALPLLVFLFAALMARPARNLIWLAVVLGLLANLCAQGFLIAIGFAPALVLRLWRIHRAESAQFRARRIALAAGIFVALCGFAAWTARPAPDNTFVDTARPAAQIGNLASGGKAPARSSPSPASSPAAPSPQISASQPAPAHGQSTRDRALDRFTTAITYGLSDVWWLSLLDFAVICVYLTLSRNLIDLAPWLLLQLFFEFVVQRPWHWGLVFVALVGILWMDWPAPKDQVLPAPGQPHSPAWRAILSLVLLAVVAEQAAWSLRAIRTDFAGEYSGDRDAARFLAGRIAGKKVAGFEFYAVGVQPYFSSNIFANQPREAFWWWSNKVPVDNRVMETMAERPDFVVIGFAVLPQDSVRRSGWDTGRETFQPEIEKRILATHPYAETHRFCGDAFSGHGYHEGLGQVVLEPITQ
jgi:hypothetical protein